MGAKATFDCYGDRAVSTLKVNSLEARTGTTISVASGNKIMMPGSVIQTQFTKYSTATTLSYSADTAIAIPGIEVSITPAASNSVIKLEASWGGETSDNSTWDHVFFFYRNTTQIPTSSDFTTSPGSSRPFGLGTACETYYAGADNSSTPAYVMVHYYDQPNTTSAVTYKLGWRANGSGTLYVNRTVGDADTGDYERYMSIISATEIAQ